MRPTSATVTVRENIDVGLLNVLVTVVFIDTELELELIQTQMAQKPMLRAEVYAHAMRASQNRKKEVRREKKV